MQDFKDSDVLIVEIDPYNDDYVVPNWEPDPANPKRTGSPTALGNAVDGPYEVETTGRSVRDILLDVEPDQETWERAQKQHARAKDRFLKRLEADNQLKDKPEAIEEEMFVWGLQNSAARTFFEMEGRGRLPLKSVTIKENRGPRVDNAAARLDEDRELNELLKRKILQDLMDKEEAKKPSRGKTTKKTEE